MTTLTNTANKVDFYFKLFNLVLLSMDSLAHLMVNNVTKLHRLSLFSESFLRSYLSTESAKFGAFKKRLAEKAREKKKIKLLREKRKLQSETDWKGHGSVATRASAKETPAKREQPNLVLILMLM